MNRLMNKMRNILYATAIVSITAALFVATADTYGSHGVLAAKVPDENSKIEHDVPAVTAMVNLTLECETQTVSDKQQQVDYEPIASEFPDNNRIKRNSCDNKHTKAITMSEGGQTAGTLKDEKGDGKDDCKLTLLSTDESQKSIEQQSFYSGDDSYLLAYIIYWENGTTDRMSDYLLELTGSVVLNRVASDQFPDTIKDVWLQKSQYATAQHFGKEADLPKRVVEIADRLLKDGPVCPSDVIFQAMFEQGEYVYYSEKGEYICGTAKDTAKQ